jgi:FkbM family methyltransferase
MKALIRRLLRPLGLDVVRTHTTMEGHLGRLLASLGVNLVVDVGAHYGEYAGLLRQVGYRGRVVSVEPVAETFARLEHSRRRDRDWRGVRVALGQEPGYAEINVTASSDLSSFLTPNAQAKAWGFPVRIVRAERVEVQRLDEILDGLCEGLAEPRVFLKLDTQGFDLAVLRGAERCLDRIVGLQTEVAMRPLYEAMPLFPDSLRPFVELGYEVTGLFAVARPDGVAAIEYDCFLRRR